MVDEVLLTKFCRVYTGCVQKENNREITFLKEFNNSV